MLIDIPDDLARRAKQKIIEDAATHRRWAKEWEQSGQHHNAVLSLVDAALADMPEPIQVGHLAKWGEQEVLVVAVDGDYAWIKFSDDLWHTVRIKDLTYQGPKPQGWGRQ